MSFDHFFSENPLLKYIYFLFRGVGSFLIAKNCFIIYLFIYFLASNSVRKYSVEEKQKFVDAFKEIQLENPNISYQIIYEHLGIAHSTMYAWRMRKDWSAKKGGNLPIKIKFAKIIEIKF